MERCCNLLLDVLDDANERLQYMKECKKFR